MFFAGGKEWAAGLEHHRQADDLWAGLEVAERSALGIPNAYADTPTLKPVSSDRTVGELTQKVEGCLAIVRRSA
jgi:hypothetical protein